MRSPYEFWVTRNNDQAIFNLPVLPEEIKIEYPGSSKTVDIDGLGEILIPKDRDALRVSFSSIFPREKISGYRRDNFVSPDVYITFFTLYMQSQTVVRFFIAESFIDLYCTVEKFSAKEVGGDIGTIHYTVTFAEYRNKEVRKIDLSALGIAMLPKPSKRIDTSESQSQGFMTYTVVKNDTLCKLARRFLGDSNRYMEIFNINRDVMKDPNIIHIGWVLKIPPK